MSFADSNRVRFGYVEETGSYGETPATPTLQLIRVNSGEFNASKQTVISDELRSDRMVGAMAETGFESSGNVSFELAAGGVYDDFIEAALCGTWGPVTDFSGTLSWNDTTKTLTDDGAGGTLGANLEVGQFILIDGFDDTGLDGWRQVSSITSNDAVVLSGTSAAGDIAGAASRTAKGKTLKNGTTLRSFSIEQGFLDISQFMMFKGQRIGSMSLDTQSGAIITGSFGFQGASIATASSTFSTGGTPTGAPVTDVLNATSNVGDILVDGTALSSALQSINLSLDNGVRSQMAVGSKYPVGVGIGRQTITGSLSAYFEDLSLYNRMLNHSDVALGWGFSDISGNGIHIELPRIKFGSSTPNAPGIDQDVMENIDFTAIANTAGTYQIRIDITP